MARQCLTSSSLAVVFDEKDRFLLSTYFLSTRNDFTWPKTGSSTIVDTKRIFHWCCLMSLLGSGVKDLF